MTDKPTPTTDLLKRCAEIHEWRSTGILSGEALRDYAKRKWPDRHETLQMAEHETVTEALALLAKWGSPVVAGESQPSAEGPPELWLQLHGDCAEPELSEPVDYTAGDVTWCWHSIHDSDVRYVRADLATTPRPTQAQAGAVPLTPERVKEIVRGAGYDQCGIPDTERAAFINGLRHGEREHGIRGGQHG